jgi:hypothetical protein
LKPRAEADLRAVACAEAARREKKEKKQAKSSKASGKQA